jgi:hypothetical protein
MPPRSFVDILASAVRKPKRVAPKRTLSSFEGDLVTFDAPLDLAWGTSSCANVEDLRPTVGSGPSLLSSSFRLTSVTAPVSHLESSSAGVQQDGVLGAQRWCTMRMPQSL